MIEVTTRRFYHLFSVVTASGTTYSVRRNADLFEVDRNGEGWKPCGQVHFMEHPAKPGSGEFVLVCEDVVRTNSILFMTVHATEVYELLGSGTCDDVKVSTPVPTGTFTYTDANWCQRWEDGTLIKTVRTWTNHIL